MPTTTQRTVRAVQDLLARPEGLAASVAALWDGSVTLNPPSADARIGNLQAPEELHDKTIRARYPTIQIYAEKVRNRMDEKFKRFSGTVRVAIEIRYSQDRLEGLTERLQFFGDAVADVLERRRGCLGEGIYLSGTYEVDFEKAKRGGLNFTQTARVICDVGVSRI